MNKFFIWCSGASYDILSKCDNREQIKYANIGIIVLCVAILSSFSATFFLSFAFDSTGNGFNFLFYPIGLLWGFIILSLDRAIVSTISKNDKIIVQILKSIPRFILALSIGLIVATPLEFKIFEKEINVIIDKQTYNIVKENVENKFNDELKLLEEKTNKAHIQYQNDKKMYEDEISGKKSGIPGKGARANEYMKNELLSLNKYNSLNDSLNKFKTNLVNYKKNIDFDKLATQYKNENIGVEERINVLYSLGTLHTFITFLFILVEILPLLVKLMSSKGSYDEVQLIIQEEIIKQNYNNLELKKLSFTNHIDLHNNDLENKKIIQNNDLENELKYNNMLHNHKYDKKLIELNNDLKLHEIKVNLDTQKKEQKIGLSKINNNNTNNLTESSDFTNTYWRQIDNFNNIYYFKKDSKGINKEFLFFNDNIITTGSWRYKNDGNTKFITISINGTKNKYAIVEHNNKILTLENNNNKIKLEKINYL